MCRAFAQLTILVQGDFVFLLVRRGLRDERKDTNHIQRHDDHKVDADSSAWGGKLPVLLHKLPLEGSKLLHGNEPKYHHGKHGCQNQRDLEEKLREVNKVSKRNIINRWRYIRISLESIWIFLYKLRYGFDMHCLLI